MLADTNRHDKHTLGKANKMRRTYMRKNADKQTGMYFRIRKIRDMHAVHVDKQTDMYAGMETNRRQACRQVCMLHDVVLKGTRMWRMHAISF